MDLLVKVFGNTILQGTGEEAQGGSVSFQSFPGAIRGVWLNYCCRCWIAVATLAIACAKSGMRIASKLAFIEISFQAQC